MKIGNTDMSKYQAKQWRVEFGQSDIKSDSEWVRGSTLPFFESNYHLFKEIDLTLLIYGSGREDIRNKISDITALLMEPVELELDGYARKFKGILTRSSVKEGSDSARKRYQQLILQFDAYEHGSVVTTSASGVGETIVYNPGNLPSPARIEITPQIGLTDLVITGICRDSSTGADLPVSMKNLQTGKKVVLDGLTGLIAESGNVKEVDIWALPSVLPGNNKIRLSSNRLYIATTILPLYM